MGISRVNYGGQTLIDLTQDTITSAQLRAGYTAHQADGEVISGTLNTAALEPYIENLKRGWMGAGNGLWTYENPTDSYADIYEVKGEHDYFLTLGGTVGTRFRVMFTTEDISKLTSGKVQGVAVNTKNLTDPAAYSSLKYTPESDGYMIIHKDNIGNASIKTYLYDTTASWL